MSNASTVAPGDMIEFYNTTSAAINIGGWFVSDSSSNLMKYRIAANTTIAAGGYYVLTEDNNFGLPATGDSGRLVAFGINANGDDVYLSSNYNGQVGGYQEHQSIPAMAPGCSYGLCTKSDGGTRYTVSSITRSGSTATATVDDASNDLQNGDSIDIQWAAQSQYDGSFVISNVTVNSSAGTTSFTYTVAGTPASPATPVAGESITAATGGTDFTLLATPTFGTLAGNMYSGAANSIPYVAPLVTDEIMYAPSQPTAAETAAGYSASDFEYVELTNRSSAAVPLNDYEVTGGIGYTPGWLADGTLANQLAVSSITRSGTTATVTINSTSTGFQNGQYINISGAAQSQYDGDFPIASLTVNSGAGTTSFTYTVAGSPASPATAVAGQSLTAGLDSEFQTLESGAAATWSASGLASASYIVYAHLNLYNGANSLLNNLDSSAQYTITCGNAQETVTIDQNQVPASFSVTSLSYNSITGLATATAANTGLSAGSIVHISGATQTQYDGTFVVQSATTTSFTYAVSGSPSTPATGTITAGLNNVWVALGTVTLSGAASVELTRTTSASPSEWTVAGGMELVSGTQTLQLGTPTFNAYSIDHPTATLAPGQYGVIVSNYAAFEERYNPSGNSNILVLGVYSGNLNNGGNTVDIDQVGQRQIGAVTALDGYEPSYRLDHVNYQNAAPWPTQPDGDGPALIRIHTADYGNDAINWWSSNAGGTPGQANIVLDQSSPSVPTNLAGQSLLTPTPEISLTWSASSDPQSDVDHYVVYRNGAAVGAPTTTSFADTTISYGVTYTYTVTAVNRDGYASAASTAISAVLPWVVGNYEPASTQIVVYFSEPLASGPGSTKGNYGVSGMSVSGVALSRDNTVVDVDPLRGHDAGEGLHGHHDQPDHGLRRSPAGHADVQLHLWHGQSDPGHRIAALGVLREPRRQHVARHADGRHRLSQRSDPDGPGELFRGPLQHRHHRQRRAALRLPLSAHLRLLRLHHRQRRQRRSCGCSTNGSPGEPHGDRLRQLVHRLPRLVQPQQLRADVHLDLPGRQHTLLRPGAAEARATTATTCRSAGRSPPRPAARPAPGS